MTNHRHCVKLIWCEKNGICFSSLLKELAKGMKVGIMLYDAS